MRSSILLLSLILTLYVPTSAQSLDYSFGDSGIIKFPYDTNQHNENVFLSIAQQQDGKLIATGDNFVVYRCNLDGTIDNTFSTNGKTLFGNIACSASEVLIDNTGKLFICGTVNDSFGITSLNSDGSFNTNFNGTGKKILPVAGSCNAAILQADNKILLCGREGWTHIVLARLLPDGTLDSTFNKNGILSVEFNGYSTGVLNSLAIKPDGGILVFGDVTSIGGIEQKFLLAQFLSNGTFDSSFGIDGKVITTIANKTGYGNDLCLQSDGKIVVVGADDQASAGFGGIIGRFLPNGNFDSSFGTNGQVLIEHPKGILGLWRVTIDVNNKIYIAGILNDTVSAYYPDTYMARYNPDGTIDEKYSKHGIVIKLSDKWDGLRGLLIQADGKVVVAGGSQIDHQIYQFTIMRYLPYALNVQPFDKNKNLRIYPNPVSDYLYLTGTENTFPEELISYWITNMSGNLIMNGKIIIKNGSTSISVLNLSQGIYQLHLTNNSGVAYRFAKL